MTAVVIVAALALIALGIYLALREPSVPLVEEVDLQSEPLVVDEPTVAEELPVKPKRTRKPRTPKVEVTEQ